ncbi:MAG: energy transducer TonB [Muribaculaceae bacterium]|nr:energy transducer TonB [Muribaculaceae bacterium]
MKAIFTSLALLIGTLFCLADTAPSFPGGDQAMKKYISENTRYPASAKDNGVEGIVTVGFLVATDGSLQQMKVVKFVDPDLEKEAIRVVSGMPKWIPAEKNGTPLEAPSKVDIPFILEE